VQRFVLVVASVAFAVAIGSSTVVGQEAKNPFEGKPVISLAGQGTQDRVAFARKLIRSQNFQGAADLLELVYETSTDDATVVNLLKTCYDQLKQYDKAELLMRRTLERTPDAVGYRLSLAEVLVRQGRTADGAAEYRTAVAGIGAADPNRQLLVIRSMMAVGQDSLALGFIDTFRESSHDSLLFGIERGSILESRSRYADAAREYLRTLNLDTTKQTVTAENRLLDLLAFQTSAAEVESEVSHYVDSTASIRSLSLLADHYLRVGQYDRAFDLSLRLDSLGGDPGYGLMRFLQACQERRIWAQVARMGDYILTRTIDGKYMMEAEFARAAALVELGRSTEAIDAYKRLSASTESTRMKFDALYGLGVLYSDYLHDPRTALVYYDSVIAGAPRGVSYINACRAVAHCHLRLGDTAVAREKFAALSGNLGPETVIEEAAYYLGLISFFERQYDSTSVQMRRLMVTYPRGFYVNDALSLLMILRDAEGADTLLNDFSSALFLQQQNRFDSARIELLKVADAENKVLADVALYRLARMEIGRSDSSAAFEVLDRLIDEFPESYYLPLGMKLKADMLFDGKRNIEQARELYRQLLESYPDYPFTNEVRDRLREIELPGAVG
jgi:tetratricopeptide (TPR) repeat protein